MALRRGNLTRATPGPIEKELVERLASGRGVRIERIVTRGHDSPRDFWYDQDESEWVVLISGRAELRFEGDDNLMTLGPGDYVDIPAHVRHRVEATSVDEDTIWLAVFYEST
jgi:cupin 2 domain-containing protein